MFNVTSLTSLIPRKIIFFTSHGAVFQKNLAINRLSNESYMSYHKRTLQEFSPFRGDQKILTELYNSGQCENIWNHK